MDKKNLLDSATPIFHRVGFKRVSVDDICLQLTISKKTFYQHYDNKEALISDFLRAEFDRLQHRFNEMKTQAVNCLDLLVQYNNQLVLKILSLNPSILFDLKRFYPHNYQLYLEQRNMLQRNFRNILEKGERLGQFRTGLDYNIVAGLRVEQLESLFKNIADDTALVKEAALFKHFLYGVEATGELQDPALQQGISQG